MRGIEGTGSTEPAADGGTGAAAAGDVVNFSNWTLYIDVDDDGGYPSLTQFTVETGIAVNYFEDVNDNDSSSRATASSSTQGEDIGRDIVVLTDWMASRLDQPRLRRGDRRREHAQQGQPGRRLAVARVRLRAALHAALAVGPDRDRLQPQG